MRSVWEVTEANMGSELRTRETRLTTKCRRFGRSRMVARCRHGHAAPLAGEATSVERFACQSVVISPARFMGRRKVKVAFDGEVAWMSSPLTVRVLSEPLWLLKSV